MDERTNTRNFSQWGRTRMNMKTTYRAKQFNLSGLKGISDETLEMHFKLYEGYVKATNALTGKISEFLADGRVDQDDMPAYAELNRRLGFEYNGRSEERRVGKECRSR